MPEFTQDESRMARELWDLRSSAKFFDGDEDVVARVKELEHKLEQSVEDHKLPEEKFSESAQRLANE